MGMRAPGIGGPLDADDIPALGRGIPLGVEPEVMDGVGMPPASAGWAGVPKDAGLGISSRASLLRLPGSDMRVSSIGGRTGRTRRSAVVAPCPGPCAPAIPGRRRRDRTWPAPYRAGPDVLRLSCGSLDVTMRLP